MAERRAGRRTADVDVAVVGCGPTGAVLANLLGPTGLRVLVLDREIAPPDLPRAVHFDGEVMRVFQSVGLAEALAPHIRPSGGMRYISASGQLLLARKPATTPGRHGWADNYLFHQPDLERCLRGGLSRFPNVRLLLGHEVEGVAGTETAAVLRLRRTSARRTLDLRAEFVVGCDGARSLVRDAIGGGLEDLGLHQPWLVVDVTLTEPVELPGTTIQYCDPSRPTTFVCVTGARRRWEIMLMPGDDPAQMTRPENVWRLLSRWLRPHQARLDRSAIYVFHSLIARRWRNRRLLIAGDSAHQTPPFLGQGMCTGIRDAANLAWKLAAVRRGAPDSLLDTYQSERAPHARRFIEQAMELGRIIQTTDPDLAAARDRRLARDGVGEIVNLSPRLGAGLHCGAAGGLVPPQPVLSDGRRLDDAIGPRFALLGRAPPSLEAAARALGAVRIDDPALVPLLAEAGAAGLVLRPDRAILGAAEDPETERMLMRLVAGAQDGRIRIAG